MTSRRCLCITTSNKIPAKKFLKELKQYEPTAACEETEIIATMKNGSRTCLNPHLETVQKYVESWKKQAGNNKKTKKGGKHQKIKKRSSHKMSQRSQQKKTA